MEGRWCSYFSDSSPTAVKEQTMCAVAARPALLLVEKKHLEIKRDPVPTLYLHVFHVTAGNNLTQTTSKVIRFLKIRIADWLLISRGVLPNRAWP